METSTRRHAEHRRHLIHGRLAAAVATVVGVVLIIGMIALSRTSLAHARRLEVAGASALSRSDVVGLSGLGRRTNVLWFDERAAEDRLRADPWVADADVSISWPFTIEISVIEREPVAVATDGLRTVLVAGDGTALSGAAYPVKQLPTIELAASGTSEGATQGPVGAARALGAMDPELRSRVKRMRVLFDGTLELWLRSGPHVRFGAPTDIGPKARAIAQALAWASSEGERILTLTVVSPGAPAATLAP